jgi:hypothetical protein
VLAEQLQAASTVEANEGELDHEVEHPNERVHSLDVGRTASAPPMIRTAIVFRTYAGECKRYFYAQERVQRCLPARNSCSSGTQGDI